MEYESLMRKRKLQNSPYLFNFLVLFFVSRDTKQWVEAETITN